MFRLIFGRKPAKNSLANEQAETIRVNSYTPHGTGRSFRSFVDCDASIKVWLPDRIELLLTELAVVHECSDSEIARTLLFIHLYGLSDFEAMRLQQNGWFKLRPPVTSATATTAITDVKYSRSSTNPYPELGKNIHSFRLWLPKAMQQDLQKVAVVHGKLMSPYVREFLIRELLGETYPVNCAEMAAPQGSEDVEKE